MRTHWITLFLLLINIMSINATIYIFYAKSGSAILKLDDVQKTVQYGIDKYKVLDSKNQNGVLTLYCESRYFECIENSSKIQVKEYQFVSLQNVKLFHWEGVGDYSIDDLTRTYASSIQDLVSGLDLDDKSRQKVLDYTGKMMRAIQNGTITQRDINGRWKTTDESLASTGINKKNIWGNYRKDDDFYKNVSAAMMENIMEMTNIYIPQKKATLINVWNIDHVEKEGEIVSNDNMNLSIENDIHNMRGLAIRNFNESKEFLKKNDMVNAIRLLERSIENGMSIDVIEGMLDVSFQQMLDTKKEQQALENILYTTVLLEKVTTITKKDLYFIRGLSKMLLGDASCENDLQLGGEKGYEVLKGLNDFSNQRGNIQIKSRSLKKDPNFKIK